MSENFIALGQIATARSGDKGNHANLGVVAYRKAGYEFLQDYLTEDIVAGFFEGLEAAEVQRFELPHLWALNFVLYDALGGGASRSLRLDTQGKLLGTAALEITMPAPDNLEDMLANND